MRTRTFDPFREFDRLLGGTGLGSGTGTPFAPTVPLDVVRHEGHVTLYFDLPGVKSDDIDLTVERNELVLTATRDFVTPEGAEQVRGERRHGEFTRRLHLGETLDTDGLTADYVDGVLVVTIPVTAEASPRRVAIGAGSADS